MTTLLEGSLWSTCSRISPKALPPRKPFRKQEKEPCLDGDGAVSNEMVLSVGDGSIQKEVSDFPTNQKKKITWKVPASSWLQVILFVETQINPNPAYVSG